MKVGLRSLACGFKWCYFIWSGTISDEELTRERQALYETAAGRSRTFWSLWQRKKFKWRECWRGCQICLSLLAEVDTHPPPKKKGLRWEKRKNQAHAHISLQGIGVKMGEDPICGMKSSLETKERVETIAFLLRIPIDPSRKWRKEMAWIQATT